MVVSPVLPDTVDAHHTADYPSTLLTVRRGQSVVFASPTTSLTVTPVSAGSSTRGRALGPAYSLKVGAAAAAGWALERVSGDADATLSLSVPVSAAPGLYSLDDGSGPAVELAVVCNPFLPADPVHMADARARAEYVLAEAGQIWRGSAESNYPAAWDYAQFDEKVVLASFWLLESLSAAKRADPVAITRHLSAAVNANGDGGVLVGRWDGEYKGGTPPSQWTGSGSILRAFYDTGRPVKYGQCWVFAGVLTSVCRALGIPTRVTTNFASAHDTTRPYNRAVDLYFDSEGDLIEGKSADSIWNFHVWCDAWMKRPDLAAEGAQIKLNLDGWQAIDATPQEMSEGAFQMGPSPLTAIKHGYAVDFDTDFVIGEVNADILYYWQKDGSKDFVVRSKRTSNVGKFTSTKAVGANRRNDVTLSYKFREGSAEERTAHANRKKPSDEIEPEPNQPSELEFSQSFKARVRFGDDVRVVIKAKNTGATEAFVRLGSLARATRYTGEPTSRLGKTTETVVVGPGRTAELAVTLTEADYTPHLVRDVQTIKFNNSAKVGATGQTWADECIVRVYGDDALAVSAPRKVTIGADADAVASVTVRNTFRVALTNVVVNAEGRGIAEPTTLKMGKIEPGAKAQASVSLKGKVGGDRTLVVTLDTDELQDITKSVVVRVIDPARMNFFTRFGAVLRGLIP